MNCVRGNRYKRAIENGDLFRFRNCPANSVYHLRQRDPPPKCWGHYLGFIADALRHYCRSKMSRNILPFAAPLRFKNSRLAPNRRSKINLHQGNTWQAGVHVFMLPSH